MTPTPIPPPDAGQAVADAYQALLIIQAEHADATREWAWAATFTDNHAQYRRFQAASDALIGAHRTLYATCAALLTPAQVAYRAYGAALVVEDAARQLYDDTPYMDDYEAKVAWQCATENKFVAYAAWQAVEGQP